MMTSRLGLDNARFKGVEAWARGLTWPDQVDGDLNLDCPSEPRELEGRRTDRSG
jgi:hypothetical protein